MTRREEHYEVTVRYYDDGAVEAMLWKQNGVDHRLGGPATTWFDRTGNVVQEIWMVNGKFHRRPEEGPSYSIIDPITRVVVHESYHVYGELHRVDGPAAIRRHRTAGSVIQAGFFLNGKQYQPSRSDRKRMLGISPS